MHADALAKHQKSGLFTLNFGVVRPLASKKRQNCRSAQNIGRYDIYSSLSFPLNDSQAQLYLCCKIQDPALPPCVGMSDRLVLCFVDLVCGCVASRHWSQVLYDISLACHVGSRCAGCVQSSFHFACLMYRPLFDALCKACMYSELRPFSIPIFRIYNTFLLEFDKHHYMSRLELCEE